MLLENHSRMDTAAGAKLDAPILKLGMPDPPIRPRARELHKPHVPHARRVRLRVEAHHCDAVQDLGRQLVYAGEAAG